LHDRGGNGRMGGINEISCVADKAGAKTDIAGLRAFDTNCDGRLTAADGPSHSSSCGSTTMAAAPPGPANFCR